MKQQIITLFLLINIPLFAQAQSGEVSYKIDYSYGLPSDTATLCYTSNCAFYTSTHGFNNQQTIRVINKTTKKERIKLSEKFSIPTDIYYTKDFMVEDFLFLGVKKTVKEPMGCINWLVNVTDSTKEVAGFQC